MELRFINYNELLPSGYRVESDIIKMPHRLIYLIYELKRENWKYVAHNESGIIYDISTDKDTFKNDLKEEIIKLKETFFALKKDFSNKNKKEITSEFYLLYDMLPEDIRKKIKIYIKDDTTI